MMLQTLLRSTLAAALLLGGAFAGQAAAAAKAGAAMPMRPPTKEALAKAEENRLRGIALAKEKKYVDAAVAFEESYKTNPRPDLPKDIGLAYKLAGDKAMAIRWYELYLASSPEAKDRADIERIVAELKGERPPEAEPPPPPSEGPVSIEANVEGAAILLDGEPLGATPFVGRAPLGTHTLTLTKEGHRARSVTIDVRADRTTEIRVNLVADGTAVAATAPAAGAEKAPPPYWKRWYFWAAIGGAVLVGAVVGIAVGVSGGVNPIVVDVDVLGTQNFRR